jgi:hypothetical protein
MFVYDDQIVSGYRPCLNQLFELFETCRSHSNCLYLSILTLFQDLLNAIYLPFFVYTALEPHFLQSDY